ncbi:MAG: glycosyl transferase family 11 [Lachnospiraceae bacterium]|jgi:hypothetical protein|nr:glycosyl transferase family 11 [Lachnospiraceae bacterium]MDF2843389.1 glycosyl transferase family 11 [Herbinix sp.]
MIEVKVFGGLGNQMFQYAFANYLRLNNEQVCLDISDYKIHKHHHGFELTTVFGIDEMFVDKNSELSIKSASLLIRVLQKILLVRISKDTEYYEQKEVSFISSEKIYSDLHMVGFWQDVRYIMPIRSHLISKFNFIKPLNDKNKVFINRINDEDTVSIHIRRGDYLANKGLGNICDEKYYNKAIKYFISVLVKPKFIFFSDDINWCKSQYGAIDAEFVDWNLGSDSYIDMQLMSICRHNIISNSTFSWWGAFLNSNESKIVLCPSKWNRNYDTNRLICEGWIALP